MVATGIQSIIVNSIDEEKWQRYNEMREHYRVMSEPRISRRLRMMRAGGRMLIAAGERLERAAAIQPVGEMSVSHSS